jgi:hypothetical protein
VSLTFTPARHLYTLDGERVPSVTTIVGVLPKGGLVYWAAKLVAETVADQASTVDAVRALGRDVMVAALRAVPDQAKRKAGDRGTLLHELATDVVRGEPSELIADPDIAACLSGLAQWFDDVGFEPELIECPIGSRAYRYAGRLDIVGTFARDRSERWLLDLKTSSSVYGDTALQTAAYASADFYVDADGRELPLPLIDRIGVVHVQPGISELYELGEISVAFDEFLHAQALYLSDKRRAALVAHPVRFAAAEGALF